MITIQYSIFHCTITHLSICTFPYLHIPTFPHFPHFILHRHRRFYPRMALVIHQFKIFEFETINILHSWIYVELW